MTPRALRVLLVEDDDTDALLVEHLVPGVGGGLHPQVRATRLVDAIALAHRDVVDVVLLDLGLPDSQGLETFTRFHAAVPDVPVVLLTGMHDDALALRAIEAGAQDYIVKDDLAHTPVGRLLAHAVERHRLQREVVQHADAMAQQQAKLRAIFDRSLDAFLLVDDAGVVVDVNPTAEALTGRSRDDLCDRPLDELVRAPDGGPLGLPELRARGDATVTARMPRGPGSRAEVELLLTSAVVPDQHLVSVRDVTDRNLWQRELVASEARFRELVELADDVLYRVRIRPHLQVEYASPSFATVTGVPVDEVYTDPTLWPAHVHPTDSTRFLDLSRLEAGHSDRLVFRWRLPDGEWAWLEDRRTPLFEGGELVAIQGMLRDVTARERTEEALRDALRQEREAVDKLQSLDRMKGTFLQALSHELRTPLTVIRGFALTLDRHGSDLSEAQRAVLVERLTAASERLERLLVDLLDVDRLTRGVVPVDRRPTNVRALVDAVLAEVEPRGHDLWVECDDDLVVSVDAPKVERILENLVRNAIKHTPAGTRVLVVVTGNEDGIVLTVEDDGPGIAPELAERVFQPFEQGAASTSDASPGTGIGLALVGKFAELHGGQAWVEPAIGGGATFVVDLPANADRAAGSPSAAPPDVPAVAGDAVVADAVRELLHATEVAEVPGILLAAVDRLGGHTTVDELDGPGVLPLDLSLGLGRPLFAAAAAGTPARAALDAHLPRLVEDAQRAAERCRELARRRPDPPRAAGPRMVAPAGLDDLVAGDSVVVVAFPGSQVDDLSVRGAARALRPCLRVTDRVVVTGDGEIVVLLPAADEDVVGTVLDRVRAALDLQQPGLAFVAGVAQVDHQGGAVACRRAREDSRVH